MPFRHFPIEEKNSSRRTSRNCILQDFVIVLFEKRLWKMKFENYLPLKVKSKLKKIDTQTVWKAEKRINLFPWVVTRSKLFEKRICLIKEKREELEFYLQTTLKVEKRHFKSFIQCFICSFYENLFYVTVCVYVLSKMYFFVGTNSFLIKSSKFKFESHQFAKVSKVKERSICVFQRNESVRVNLKIFHQVCFKKIKVLLFEKAQFSIISWEELVR